MSFSAPIEFEKHGWSASQGLIIRTTNEVDWAFADLCGVIKRGTLSDGGSSPRFVWSLGISPFDGDFFDESVLHDSIYRDKETKFTRKQADQIYLAAMTEGGVAFWKRHTVYRAVRMFGWKAWNDNRKQPSPK